MKHTSINNVKVYTVNTDKALPDFISDNKRRALLKKDAELRNRITLIQDFEFPTAATNIQMSPNNEYILATGVYKPRVNCYQADQLGLKFTRFLTSDIVNFSFLGEDFRKLAFLTSDRTIEIHAAYGKHYTTRIPRFGRDMCYDQENCDLYSVGAGSEIYRLNLDEGIFQQPFQGSSPEFNVCKLNPVHQLLAVGGTDGFLEIWDPRGSVRAARIGVSDTEISSIAHHKDGLMMGVGLSSGKVLLYDIRSKSPLLVKDHQYGFPIKQIQFHNTSKNVVSADCKVIKIWNQNDGKAFTSIENEANLNDFVIPEDSGLILTANETPKMNAYYIPEMGYAPKWCHHLDGLTEEMEENNDNTVYDDYKFVEKENLAKYGLEKLIGTNYLRAYMHGYFVDKKLFNELIAATQPFAYDDYRKEQINKKLKEKRENRIGVVKKLPKVNKKYAEHLLSEPGKKKKAKQLKEGVEATPLQDDRFGALWTNKDFGIDVNSEEYKLKHPHRDQITSQFDEMDEDDNDSESDQDNNHKNKNDDDMEVSLRAPKMFELKDGHSFTVDSNKLAELNKKKKMAKAPLGMRVNSESAKTIENAKVRDRVITVKIKKSEAVLEREREQKQHMKERREARRSVKELRLPKIRNTHYSKK